jgi:hypothetical protein
MQIDKNKVWFVANAVRDLFDELLAAEPEARDGHAGRDTPEQPTLTIVPKPEVTP